MYIQKRQKSQIGKRRHILNAYSKVPSVGVPKKGVPKKLGGDPLVNGTGGSDEQIKGEFTANGVQNNISHTRGTISMARALDYNSASSQFFIVHEDSTFLDGQYAGFGTVLEGMEIVDKICEDTKVEDSNGTVLKENQPVIEKIVMVD